MFKKRTRRGRVTCDDNEADEDDDDDDDDMPVLDDQTIGPYIPNAAAGAQPAPMPDVAAQNGVPFSFHEYLAESLQEWCFKCRCRMYENMQEESHAKHMQDIDRIYDDDQTNFVVRSENVLRIYNTRLRQYMPNNEEWTLKSIQRCIQRRHGTGDQASVAKADLQFWWQIGEIIEQNIMMKLPDGKIVLDTANLKARTMISKFVSTKKKK